MASSNGYRLLEGKWFRMGYRLRHESFVYCYLYRMQGECILGCVGGMDVEAYYFVMPSTGFSSHVSDQGAKAGHDEQKATS